MVKTLFHEDDEFLIKRFVSNDESAFEELFRRYEQKIFNLVYRYIGPYPETEELTQDVFIKVYKSAQTFKGKSKFSTWIYRIAVNTCLNYKKKKRLVMESLDKSGTQLVKELVAPDSTTPEEQFTRARKMAIIQQALDSLPPNQKIAFILSKYEGFSYAEIGEIMNVSISSVESLLFRAKQQLKKELTPYKEIGEL
jgi:RNA polymerase sigma-70 factor (ECF subfamily)